MVVRVYYFQQWHAKLSENQTSIKEEKILEVKRLGDEKSHLRTLYIRARKGWNSGAGLTGNTY